MATEYGNRRPQGAAGANSDPAGTKPRKKPKGSGRYTGNREFIFDGGIEPQPKTSGPQGNRGNRGSMNTDNNLSTEPVPGPKTDPSSRPDTDFGRGLVGLNAGMASEIRRNPGGIVNYYYDVTGRNPGNGAYGTNIDYASVLSNLFDLVGGASATDNNAFADFVGRMLENANTPGATSYGTQDILNAFVGNNGPGDAMTLLEGALANPAMSGADQVKAVNSFLNSLAQFTMSPLMAAGLANINDLRGDQFLSGVFQGMNQDTYLSQTQNDLRNLIR